MEELTAFIMRTSLRECLKRHGGVGTVYFAKEGAPLFICSLSGTWMPDKIKELKTALEHLGNIVTKQEGKLFISPDDLWIRKRICELSGSLPETSQGILSQRLCLHPMRSLSEQGMQLVIEVLRLAKYISKETNRKQNAGRVNDAIQMIRRSCAVALRKGDDSGFYEMGLFLAEIERYCRT